MKSAVPVVSFPQSSVATNMYDSVIVVTVPTQEVEIFGVLLVIVTEPPQSSVPLALINQAALAPVTSPSHSTVLLAVGVVRFGAVSSIMIKYANAVIIFPQSSSAVKVYSVVLVSPH